MCSSRLALDPVGRPVVVATTADPFTPVGATFLVRDVYALGWFEPHGRKPSAREKASARPPYEVPRSTRWDKPADVPDDQLDEREALKAARLEQQRTPPDLVNVAA